VTEEKIREKMNLGFAKKHIKKKMNFKPSYKKNLNRMVLKYVYYYVGRQAARLLVFGRWADSSQASSSWNMS
jgi:hypothetical protein